MSEWWTYRLSDLILFSPDGYYRTFALYHHRTWPAHLLLLLVLVTAAIACRRMRDHATRGRVVMAIAAVSWLWIAIAFHLQAYASINWAAKYFAGAFLLQAALMAWIAARRPIALDGSAARVLLGGIVLLALAAPVVGVVTGRQWDQVEFLGVTPDPTAAATILLLRLSRPVPRVALVIPVASCLVGGLTLSALHSPEGWWPWISALVALVVPVWVRPRSRAPDLEDH